MYVYIYIHTYITWRAEGWCACAACVNSPSRYTPFRGIPPSFANPWNTMFVPTWSDQV